MRKVVVDTSSLCKLNNNAEALKYIKKSGIKAYDLTIDYDFIKKDFVSPIDHINFANELKKIQDSLGLECVQTHAYFSWGIDEEMMKKRFEYIIKDLEISKILGASIVVVHPIWELSLEDNAIFFKKFIPTLKKLDIQIAIENIYGADEKYNPAPVCSSTPENLNKILNLLNDSHFGVCIDIGHAEMKALNTSAKEMIEKMSDKVITLHIHDNDKVNDLHQIPYTQSVNFEEILDSLKKINYKGNIVFEVESCYKNMPKELYIPTLKYLNEIGKYFINRLDE